VFCFRLKKYDFKFALTARNGSDSGPKTLPEHEYGEDWGCNIPNPTHPDGDLVHLTNKSRASWHDAIPGPSRTEKKYFNPKFISSGKTETPLSVKIYEI
jgi:hypothetical protein